MLKFDCYFEFDKRAGHDPFRRLEFRFYGVDSSWIHIIQRGHVTINDVGMCFVWQHSIIRSSHIFQKDCGLEPLRDIANIMGDIVKVMNVWDASALQIIQEVDFDKEHQIKNQRLKCLRKYFGE